MLLRKKVFSRSSYRRTHAGAQFLYFAEAKLRG
jgi:hypothetical protein